MTLKRIGAGALAGLIAAVGVDYHAYTQNPRAFDWKLAAGRWFFGAVSGAASAAGFGAAFGGN